MLGLLLEQCACSREGLCRGAPGMQMHANPAQGFLWRDCKPESILLAGRSYIP
jgi:hypothetical protein